MIAFLVFGICIGIYSLHYSLGNQLDELDIPAESKTVICVFALVLFDPLLLAVRHYARLENVKPVGIIAAVIFVVLSVCMLANIMPLQ